MIKVLWIKTLMLLMSMLQFTETTGQNVFIIRDGDDDTLPCGNVIDHQNKCDSTTWLFCGSRNSAAVSLFELGEFKKEAESKSDRLSVTENCSLVIKKVTDEDVGRYTCRQFISGRQLGGDSDVDLSVVNITENKSNNETSLFCTVRTHDQCRLTVKWLNEDNNNHLTDMKTSQSSCSATVTFTTSDFNQYSDLLKCEVTDGHRTKQQFPFRRQTSAEKPGQLWFVIGAVGSAVLLLSVVAFVLWKKTKGNKTQMIEDTANPEDGISYASIVHTKKYKKKTWVQSHDRGTAVTYSTVKTSSSPAAASTDPSDLYATIS